MSGIVKRAVAAFVASTPIAGIIATNVQSAIAELNTKKADDAATTAAIAAAITTAVNTAVAAAVAPGAATHFATAAAPAGWLKANGALVSRSAYAGLFAAIGTLYGVGDGATTFALPDLRGEFFRSMDDSRGIDTGRTLGSAQGHLMAAHTHTYNDYYPVTIQQYVGTGEGVIDVAYTYADTTRTTASNSGAETRPRNVALLACIKY